MSDGVYDDSLVNARPIICAILDDAGVPQHTLEYNECTKYGYGLFESFEGHLTPLELSQMLIAFNEGQKIGVLRVKQQLFSFMGWNMPLKSLTISSVVIECIQRYRETKQPAKSLLTSGGV